jgi:hypothetical protein
MIKQKHEATSNTVRQRNLFANRPLVESKTAGDRVDDIGGLWAVLVFHQRKATRNAKKEEKQNAKRTEP